MTNSCSSCGVALAGGGMMSSDGEVCQSCFDTIEPSGLRVGGLEAVVAGAAALPLVFQVWVNGLGYVHLGAGAVGVAVGAYAIGKSVKSELPASMATLGIAGGGGLLCLFHLLRGAGVV